MPMTPGLRKFALTAHVTSSVGWIGAVVAFLVIALIALLHADAEKVRAAATTMELIGWFVIVPFSLASLASGIIQSLGTTWGLFKHYWVIAKLMITVGASVLLVLHMQVVSSIAVAAAEGAARPGHLQGPKTQVAADAAAALVVLLIAAALSIYKPQGRTNGPTPRWVYVTGALVVVMIMTFVIRHLAAGGMHSHR